jgi:hypothetical protein
MSSASLRTLNPRKLTDRRISSAEGLAVLAFSMAASFAAIVWSWNHAAMLNYGDAVAHLHIARRVFDSRIPRFSELGSVWLPLPHILLMPFVENYAWWADGLAGVIPSALAYIASCAGIYRLARHWLNPAPAALTLAFFAFNPNLLYLQTTAMTEPLFLCEVIWIVLWLVEWQSCIDESSLKGCGLQGIAAALIAAIFTRYDGWIIALLAWTGIGIALLKRGRLRYSPYFWLGTAAIVAAPIAWFLYNSIGFGDWLYFARGPYSAAAIELRTSAAGAYPPHPGWHNPWVALLFYLKVSELDAVLAPAWGSLWGNLVLAAAAIGSIAGWCTEKSKPHRRALAWTSLLWLPVPFYAWSVAYGSVPIFFPAWWPFTFYNTRYGLELLPALALGVGFAAKFASGALDRWQGRRYAQFLPEIVFAILFLLAGVNASSLLRQRPIVYAESTYNLDARLPYDQAIPPLLRDLLHSSPHGTVLMNTSMYPEIVAFTGIPLRQTINESDLEIWRAALLAPSSHAAIVVAFDGDDVDRAVKDHPEGLAIAGRFSAENQPTATIYISTADFERTPHVPTGSPGPNSGIQSPDAGSATPGAGNPTR